MNIEDYLAALDTKLHEMVPLIAASSIEREIDSNTGIGLVRGTIRFVNGSRFEFTEQLPTDRRKFRLHYMDAANKLIVRWDSAPHHKELATFPFHLHKADKVEAHNAITALDALDQIARMLKV